jgi:hypothetical protein
MKRIQPVACLLQLPKVTGAYRAKAFEFIPSPFFQTIRATAAILRAKVNRAISARMPLSFNAAR